MKSWLRQHRYAFSTALTRLIAQPFSSAANLLVMALTLALPLISWALLVSAQPLAHALPVNPEITVYLTIDTTRAQAEALRDEWHHSYDAQVSEVLLLDRDEAHQQLAADPLWSDALATLGENPLPHALVLRLQDDPDQQIEIATRLADELRAHAASERVQLDSEWVRRVAALLGFARIALLALSLSVVAIVIASIFNTVRLQALNQREEIAVARLVGATESFVRRPFLYQGALSGILASVIAIVLTSLALQPLSTALNRLANHYDVHVYLHLPATTNLLLATLAVAFVAALAARWSVTRSTQF